jgi:ArsR family transcriptional regulator
MKETAKIFKLFSDESRLRIVMLLSQRELCVCQLMGVLGVSQPLVSRNLSLLKNAGLLDERRDGKLIYYSLKKQLASVQNDFVSILKRNLKNNEAYIKDTTSLSECTEFQKKTGKCDMKTFLAYMDKQKEQKRRNKNAAKI